mmetsp:Transcript_13807/g.22870  ORF Transcript_13807/g.22870 Transcript_13807/m.22870 type:complete len:214 (+) Transcript_13807:470-1111(+)
MVVKFWRQKSSWDHESRTIFALRNQYCGLNANPQDQHLHHKVIGWRLRIDFLQKIVLDGKHVQRCHATSHTHSVDVVMVKWALGFRDNILNDLRNPERVKSKHIQRSVLLTGVKERQEGSHQSDVEAQVKHCNLSTQQFRRALSSIRVVSRLNDNGHILHFNHAEYQQFEKGNTSERGKQWLHSQTEINVTETEQCIQNCLPSNTEERNSCSS